MTSSRFLPLAAALFGAVAAYADPALTIYNQNFAVVRETVPLELKAGVTDVSYADTTAHLEPDSVILRDGAGKTAFQILEQSYRNDPVSQERLLSLFEGKTIDFLVQEQGQPDQTVRGKIVRSGYLPRVGDSVPDNGYMQGAAPQPVIEVDGRLRFGLPGIPLFPSLGDDTILKPALNWRIEAQGAQKLNAELAYVTGGMSWHADYNLVAPGKGDNIDLVGWITLDNQSGKTFDNARIKLMAGHVNKIQPRVYSAVTMGGVVARAAMADMVPVVKEKAFDEYHLYTVQNPVTLRDRETKQVEFIHASNVTAPSIYVYDGARFNGEIWNSEMAEDTGDTGSGDGAEGSTKVAVVREIKNTAGNELGIPLPAGRIRFYRENDDGQPEFIGENEIDHTPKDETLHIYTGDAFDLVGERKQTSYHVSENDNVADESFEIRLRNHKTEPVEIRVVEHPYRWENWSITRKSDPFTKISTHEIRFLAELKPGEEKVVSYTVHYSW